MVYLDPHVIYIQHLLRVSKNTARVTCVIASYACPLAQVTRCVAAIKLSSLPGHEACLTGVSHPGYEAYSHLYHLNNHFPLYPVITSAEANYTDCRGWEVIQRLQKTAHCTAVRSSYSVKRMHTHSILQTHTHAPPRYLSPVTVANTADGYPKRVNTH